MSEELAPSFDVHAAWLRKACTDTSAFMAALAARFEEALPQQVVVHRKRRGLFSRETRVEKLTILAQSAHYEVCVDGASALRCSRARVVGGITLKTEILEVSQWLGGLEAELAEMAQRMGANQSVLHDFLLS